MDWGLPPPSPFYALLIFQVANIGLQKCQTSPKVAPYTQSLFLSTLNTIDHVKRMPQYEQMDEKSKQRLNFIGEDAANVLSNVFG